MRTRTFILVAVAVFAVLVGGFLYVALSGDGDDRRIGALRPYTAGKLALNSAGSPLGYLKSARCGHVSAGVTRQSPELMTKGGVDPKQIGSVQYDSCELTFGLGMEPELYAWINEAMAGKAAAKNLTIQSLDFDNKEQKVLELGQALLTEFSMPDLDAANKEAAFMTITVQPQSLTAKPGSGAVSAATTSSKLLVPGNFKFAYAGVDAPKVSKISGFGFDLPVGTQRPQFREFTITVPDSDPEPFAKLLQTFVVDGLNGPGYEKLAKLTFLNSTLTATVATLTLSGVGAAGGDLVGTLESFSETAAKRKYTLYAEGASLTIGP